MGFQKINEILQKPDYAELARSLKQKTDKGIFDYDETNIFGKGVEQEVYKVPSLKQEDEKYIAEFVKTVPFTMIAKEFLAQGATASGATYLVPTKIYQILQTYASPADIINDVSMAVIPAAEIPGSTLDVPIAKRGSYAPHTTTSGGKAPEEEIGFTKATLSFAKTLTVNFNIGNDLVEDVPQLSLIEVHVRMAGAEMGKRSTTEVLSVMASTDDGDGILNTVTAADDSTTLAKLRAAVDKILVDEFIPDRLLAPSHSLVDAIMTDTTYMVSGGDTGFRDKILHHQDPLLWGLQWIRCEHSSMYTVGTHATSNETEVPTACKLYVFAKDYSYISGRKRWMRIENYSDPIRDLAGAVITSRQDTVSVYDDSVCKISEA